MRPLSKPLNVLIALLLTLAFGFWVTGQLAMLADGLVQFKYVFALLIAGAVIALIALWYRGALGQVQVLFTNPVAATIAKILAVTVALIFASSVAYTLMASDAGNYKGFILKREFVLWAIFLPLIISALVAVYAPIGIPTEYRSAIALGLKKFMVLALAMTAVLVYFFPEDKFSKSVFSEIKLAADLVNDRVLKPTKDKLADVGRSKPPQIRQAADPPKPEKPRVIVHVESPKTIWVPYSGSQQDADWYRWAAHSLETREACRDSDPCQKAMWRLREYGCLAPNYRLLERCGG